MEVYLYSMHCDNNTWEACKFSFAFSLKDVVFITIPHLITRSVRCRCEKIILILTYIYVGNSVKRTKLVYLGNFEIIYLCYYFIINGKSQLSRISEDNNIFYIYIFYIYILHIINILIYFRL